MNPSEVLRIVDAIHRDKNIDKEIVFEGIEAALVSAAKKHYGEEANIVVNIDREDGSIRARSPVSPLTYALSGGDRISTRGGARGTGC